MIEQVGQGRMLARLEQTTCVPGGPAAVLVLVALQMVLALPALGQNASTGNAREDVGRTQRQEGEAILALADAVMAGKPAPLDFALQWQNDFVKAQRGTFVPFTLTVDASGLSRPAALIYVRALRRLPGGEKESPKDRRAARSTDAEGSPFPVDAIFPVELERIPGRLSRISRGFSVLPGEYDVFVVVRERVEPGAGRSRPKVSVLRQPISVPDFWTNELTTSSMIVADRLSTLAEPIAADRIAEHPYAIGRNEITPAVDRVFRRDEELIVVFLVYNPMVTPERHFDVKVEYHFFRKARGTVDAAGSTVARPREQQGETYVNHTDPQRFTPALMGAGFDPGTGEPVMAGQVVPLAGFQEGEYRLAVQIVDLLSGKTISRDVFFTVGS